MADAADGDEHQHMDASSALLVLSGIQCGFGPVGYRTPDGLLYWDLNYFFDALGTSGGDNASQFKHITSLQQLCRSEELLSPRDLHCKRKTPRWGARLQNKLFKLLKSLLMKSLFLSQSVALAGQGC